MAFRLEKETVRKIAWGAYYGLILGGFVGGVGLYMLGSEGIQHMLTGEELVGDTQKVGYGSFRAGALIASVSFLVLEGSDWYARKQKYK